MADEPVPWSNVVGVPGWMNDLEKLGKLSAGAISTLATIATNPKEWVRTVILEWVVGGTLDGAQYVLGWVYFAFERSANIILDGLGPLATPFVIIGDAVVLAIDTVYGAAISVANMAGLVGPPAAAFAVALVVTVLAVVVFATAKVIPGSDFVEGGLEALR